MPRLPRGAMRVIVDDNAAMGSAFRASRRHAKISLTLPRLPNEVIRQQEKSATKHTRRALRFR